MADMRKLEYFLLRYVPNAARDEFVNVGLVMTESGGDGFADARFTHDWRGVRCLDAEADVELIEALEHEVRGQLMEVQDRDQLLKRLRDSFSNTIQLSPTKGCLTKDPAIEIETIAKMYLEPAKVPAHREASGRQKILGTMRQAFEQAGVLKMMPSLPIAQYTKPGDPFRFDFGYRVGTEIKLFHAVSLRASVDAAVTLAARFPKIAEGMNSAIGVQPVLTAVVDDGLPRSEDEIGFALGMMEESRIRIAAVADMPKIAEQARVELRA
jgi:hypothetical protein